jgi:hypothetical protein
MCNGTDPLPSGKILNLGDRLKFSINICNDQGQAPATAITVYDNMINLALPSGYSDFHAYYNGSSLQYDGTSNSGSANHYYITGTAPNQTLVFNLTSNGDNIPAGNINNLVFEASLAVPSGFNGQSARFQNNFYLSYSNPNPSTTNVKGTPLLPFYTGSSVPTINEIP